MSEYMPEFLPKEVLEGLELARKRDSKRRSRLRVRTELGVYPILKLWDEGFTVARDNADQLRGLVGIYDGARHLYQALIVASHDDGFTMSFDFKRSTATTDRPALDYDQNEDAPVALLPHH
ncbi:hypothetical protein [Pacificibacter sp. AS14]|uniref:hypothetical protein n=1 Tax=Pacificibacter sp. AS14 TaxID=3135785 RepID=UPI00316E4C6B